MCPLLWQRLGEQGEALERLGAHTSARVLEGAAKLRASGFSLPATTVDAVVATVVHHLPLHSAAGHGCLLWSVGQLRPQLSPEQRAAIAHHVTELVRSRCC